VSCEIKYATYIVQTSIRKACGEGGTPSVGVTSFQRQHLLGES
jgi:hypothetical protein